MKVIEPALCCVAASIVMKIEILPDLSSSNKAVEACGRRMAATKRQQMPYIAVLPDRTPNIL
jgi:hypothetical protein